MRPLCLLLILVVILNARARAATSGETAEPPAWLSELNAPVTWHILGLGLMGSLAMMGNEDSTELGKSIKESSLDGISDFGNLFGSGWGVGGLAVASWSFGAVVGEPAAQELGSDLIGAFLLSSAAVWAVKAPVNRGRPNGGEHSFPSGHTAAAFSTVPPVWRHAGWKAGLGMGALATATGLGRIQANKHHLSDVIAGAALGLVRGRIAVAACHCGWWVEPSPRGLSAGVSF
ncbi:MAG TPA: phosphatase PAP2 family protein [Candidatus Krumholzibacteria bacterium]|nr:phosphatase PAP2 family protein [Candidatus Krumholzibacteria bacterium]